jgi:hypothetical protein
MKQESHFLENVSRSHNETHTVTSEVEITLIIAAHYCYPDALWNVNFEFRSGLDICLLLSVLRGHKSPIQGCYFFLTRVV